jgi:dTDP-4-dehydrorhamnose reductase
VTRALILGGTGMLGHLLWRQCRQSEIDAVATVRSDSLEGRAAAVLDRESTLTGVRAEEPETVTRALDRSGADVAVNCIGVVKQSAAARDDPATTIQVSTDCVFSGREGAYAEDDIPDPVDLYGRSKLLGEVVGAGALTIRTSMIGFELETANGLLAWFLGEAGGSVRGYSGAVFSGPTTPVLARALVDLIERHRGLEGLYHLGADPIDKNELLHQLRDALSLDVEIEPDDSVRIDRSLDSSRFRAATGWKPPSWTEMVAELAAIAPEYGIREGSLARR